MASKIHSWTDHSKHVYSIQWVRQEKCSDITKQQIHMYIYMHTWPQLSQTREPDYVYKFMCVVITGTHEMAYNMDQNYTDFTR